MTMTTDHSANLTSALGAFEQDGDTVALQTAYRAIPTAARAGAMTSAMLAHPSTVAAFLDAVNNLPAAPSSRVRPSLTDDQRDAVRAVIVLALSSIPAEAGIVGEAVAVAVERVARFAVSLPIGTERQSHDVEPCSIVPAGSVLTASVKGAAVEGVLNADGTVTSGSQSGSLSSVAGTLLGRSQNGWSFWRYEGRTLAQIRDAS